MTRIFSIHKGANAIYVTDNGLKERKTPPLPLPEYKSWIDVKEYFVKLGATDEALNLKKRATRHCRLTLPRFRTVQLLNKSCSSVSGISTRTTYLPGRKSECIFHSLCCGSLYKLAQYNEHLEASRWI